MIVAEGLLVGQGRTADGGRPHAETEALAMAGEAAQGATAYVTLEPCAHHGQTPPCAEALLAAGIARVVIGAADPDPRVNGQGIALLREHGVTVVEGVEAKACMKHHAGFLMRAREGRPFVTLKIAASLDGRIATRTGKSQWISSPSSRTLAHQLRGRVDAVVTGSGTLLADDPLLTCRLPGYEKHQPVRVVFDRAFQIEPEHRLAQTARQHPVWVVVSQPALEQHPVKMKALRELGVRIFPCVPGADVVELMQLLGEQGINHAMVEAGPGLATACLRHGMVDEIWWFAAPLLLGGDGLPALEGLEITDPGMAPRFRLAEQRQLEQDMLLVFRPVSV
jgi:diaminohydroxyphosphoribosylaminopyrimidine deaminase/5-amino-6-(5-phosphoribosylamino)uracil reductase